MSAAGRMVKQSCSNEVFSALTITRELLWLHQKEYCKQSLFFSTLSVLPCKYSWIAGVMTEYCRVSCPHFSVTDKLCYQYLQMRQFCRVSRPYVIMIGRYVINSYQWDDNHDAPQMQSDIRQPAKLIFFLNWFIIGHPFCSHLIVCKQCFANNHVVNKY